MKCKSHRRNCVKFSDISDKFNLGLIVNVTGCSIPLRIVSFRSALQFVHLFDSFSLTQSALVRNF